MSHIEDPYKILSRQIEFEKISLDDMKGWVSHENLRINVKLSSCEYSFISVSMNAIVGIPFSFLLICFCGGGISPGAWLKKGTPLLVLDFTNNAYLKSCF